MDAMVTGRMSEEKKAAGNAVLAESGLNASQAIGLMYDRLIAEKDASFLVGEHRASAAEWDAARQFFDGLTQKRKSRFHSMSKAQIKQERVLAREAH